MGGGKVKNGKKREETINMTTTSNCISFQVLLGFFIEDQPTQT